MTQCERQASCEAQRNVMRPRQDDVVTWRCPLIFDAGIATPRSHLEHADEKSGPQTLDRLVSIPSNSTSDSL